MIGKTKTSMLTILFCATEVLTRFHTGSSGLISDGERNSIMSLTDTKSSADQKSNDSSSKNDKKDNSKKDNNSKLSSLTNKTDSNAGDNKSSSKDSSEKKKKDSGTSSSDTEKNNLIGSSDATKSPIDSYLTDPSSKQNESNSELTDSKKTEEKDKNPKNDSNATTPKSEKSSSKSGNSKSKLVDSMENELPETILKASRLVENPLIKDNKKSDLVGSDNIFDYVKENSGKLDSLSGLVDTVITNRNSDKPMKGSFGKDSTALV
ncbi:uncharacterized protein VICG_01517 [Vittaforma corneae ATCC 50505]|uniref:Dentin sialophosphoprotein-like n=1 Tax=Vittaforma corneae (strain ATCC 50505) TaxID=993615 RepID=L2GM82_VITCO|nr:uncharacterized protein VICG_01517 [Vittaforma corneae ATCC 50505]ELA41412.1 hypothetical protein VICG_01517 [Vittaforma corneae ATCC 50505]